MTTIPEAAYKLEDPAIAERAAAAAESLKSMQGRARALAATLGPTIQPRYMTSPLDDTFTRTILRSITAPEEALPEGWVYIKARRTVEPVRKGPGREAAVAALQGIQPAPEQPRNILIASGVPEATEDHRSDDGTVTRFFFSWFAFDGAVYVKFLSGMRRNRVAGAWQEIPVPTWHKAREDREVDAVMSAMAA